MQMLVTCTAQEPLVIVENKEGGQNREPLKKKVFFFKNEQNEFYAEAIGAFAERLEKNPTCTVEKSDCRLNISPHSALLL